eukprot:4775016-Heterocapsa_arctica.AAC.1
MRLVGHGVDALIVVPSRGDLDAGVKDVASHVDSSTASANGTRRRLGKSAFLEALVELHDQP